jgi:hypothetical protein
VFYFATSDGSGDTMVRGSPVVLAIVLVALTLFSCSPRDDQGTSSTAATNTSQGRERPDSPSEEQLAPRRQLLHSRCDEGDDDACAELSTLVDEDSDEYTFAITCGGREQEPICAPSD